MSFNEIFMIFSNFPSFQLIKFIKVPHVVLSVTAQHLVRPGDLHSLKGKGE